MGVSNFCSFEQELPASYSIRVPTYFDGQTRVFNFCSFEQELPTSYSICVPKYFGDSTGESTDLSMKNGDPSTNGFDLNKNNIIKPTLDHLSEEDCKVLKACHKEVDEIFLSRYEEIR
jgi:hypothetical protein